MGNTDNLVLLHRRFYAQALRSHHEKDWAYLYLERPHLPEGFRAFLCGFERVYVFAPQSPNLLIRNLQTIGDFPVEWIPSFPEGEPKESVPDVQQRVLSGWGIPWVGPAKALFLI